MDWLKDIISNYLRSVKTDYAILINGNWGSGKTFYVKSILSDHINSIDYNQSKKYCAVYISLFGLANSEELSDKILLQLNPGLKKIFTIGAGLVKKIIEKQIGFDIGSEAKELISLYNIPKEKVLIFDDLERLESQTLNEVLGFINSYTEHENLKVLIIANEEELIKKYEGTQAL